MVEGDWAEGMGTVGSREELPTELECSAQALALLVTTSARGRKRALSCPVPHKGDAEVSLVQLFWEQALLHVCFFQHSLGQAEPWPQGET